MCKDGRKPPKKKAVHSRWVGCRFNKQGNLLMKLVLGNPRMSRSPHSSTRILKVYEEALTGFSDIHSPDGLNDTLLSQDCVLGQLLLWEQRAEGVYQGQRSG